MVLLSDANAKLFESCTLTASVCGPGARCVCQADDERAKHSEALSVFGTDIHSLLSQSSRLTAFVVQKDMVADRPKAYLALGQICLVAIRYYPSERR